MRGGAGPGRLRHRLLHTIAERRLWSPGDRVAVAVSGGRDSMALLDLLVATQGAHGARLSVLTVDHGTRAGSSGDADFVVERSQALDLPVHRVTCSLGTQASEAACREARRAAYGSVKADRVALAHHRDDQAETLLLQLLRGTGTRGLAGMAWRRGRLVRPLLDVSPAELASWCAHRELLWREDPTNAEPRFLRNRLRSEVLPLLEALRPGALGALARTAAVVAVDDAHLMDELERVLGGRSVTDGLDCAWVAQGPPALVARALLLAAPDLTQAQVALVCAAAARGEGRVEVGAGRVWSVEAGIVRLEETPPTPGRPSEGG